MSFAFRPSAYQTSKGVEMKRRLGLLLLGIWLILYGWQAFTTPGYTTLSIVMGVLAVVVGILLLIDR